MLTRTKLLNRFVESNQKKVKKKIQIRKSSKAITSACHVVNFGFNNNNSKANNLRNSSLKETLARENLVRNEEINIQATMYL
jgi:hypothetical protein